MKKKLIIVFLLLPLVLSGCQLYQSMQSIKQSSVSGTLLFADDFSDNSNKWGTSGNNVGTIRFVYNGLDIKVDSSNSLLWTVNGDKFRDTQIEADGVLLSGPANDAFGVICRFQDNQNFYGFLLTHDGYYGIFKMQDGKMTLANLEEGLKFSEAIRQGGVVNHIQAVCQGNRLKLSANGTLLSEIQDDSYSEGQLGLIVGTYDTGGSEVFFDNLQVYQP